MGPWVLINARLYYAFAIWVGASSDRSYQRVTLWLLLAIGIGVTVA